MEEQRQKKWSLIGNDIFDVVVVGGGINGACVYNELCNKGYKVLIIDKGDFSSGTSQSSAMMVWGGLLYLRDFHFKDVYFFSGARDFMIKKMSSLVRPNSFRYIAKSRFMSLFVKIGLYVYWLLGKFNRKKPFSEVSFKEVSFLQKDKIYNSLVYEEALLIDSDSRFVLQFIIQHQSESTIPMNYCSLDSANYNNNDKLWNLKLTDTLKSNQHKTRCRFIVNCSGVWTDEVNKKNQIETPYRHVLSKGVFLNFKRHSGHDKPLVFETEKDGDAVTFSPFGHVSMWGPTETLAENIEDGFNPNNEDLSILLKQSIDNLKNPLKLSDIISIRCGIRPLAVLKDFEEKKSPLLVLSRNSLFVLDQKYPWITTYGGKITGCIPFAEKVVREIRKSIIPNGFNQVNSMVNNTMEMTTFPGLQEEVPTLRWCVQNELCCTLDDYLRRRTNISQWVIREGLGFNNENIPFIRKILEQLYPHNKEKIDDELKRYEEKVVKGFDALVKNGKN